MSYLHPASEIPSQLQCASRLPLAFKPYTMINPKPELPFPGAPVTEIVGYWGT